MYRTSGQGFTLLELLIVIAIIGVLAAVLVPNLLGARRAASNMAAQTLLRQAVTQAESVRDAGVFSATDTAANNAHDCNYAGINLTQWGAGQSVTKCRITQDAVGSYAYSKSSAGIWFYYDGVSVRNMGTAWTVPW